MLSLLRRVMQSEGGNVGGEFAIVATLIVVVAGSLLVDAFNPRL